MGAIAIEESINSNYSVWVREALDELPHSFSIVDPSIPGEPIVFASRELLKMSGYSREEVIGKNARMFQGVNTNRRSVMEIRQAVTQERTIQLTLLNYHKDGTPYWILFHMFPVFSNEDGRLIHFVALQLPITHINNNNIHNIMPPKPRGFCRREVCSASAEFELTTLPPPPPDTDNTETPPWKWKASDLDTRGANSAMANILSILTHYSQLTGRLVSEKRCCSTYMSGVGASLNISLARIKQSFVLTDPHKTGIPIVYVSDAFLELTGYARHQVLGQSCRFLSGQETDVSTESQITNSIQTGKPCTVCILNYRKDGTPFWNSLHISPVRNASGKFDVQIAYFVEVQMNVNGENKQSLRPEMSVVAAVKVAVRTSGMITATSNS